MKNKITPSVILLFVFYLGNESIKALLSIRNLLSGLDSHEKDTGNKEDHGNDEQSLDAFISQVKDKQQALNDAQTSFSSAVKEKKDLLNYRCKQIK